MYVEILPLHSQQARFKSYNRVMIKVMPTRAILRICGFKSDYLGKDRKKIGENPYPRRSVLALALINLQEIWRFVFAIRPTKIQMRRTKSLRNSMCNKKALILGNGPSLNKLNVERVNQDDPDIWVVNNFYRYKLAKDLRVTHYVITDPEHIRLNGKDRNRELEEILSFIREKSATIVLPHWTLDAPHLTKLENVNVLYLDDRQLSAWSNNTSPLKPRGYLTITLYKALGFALFLGYKEICILGMDNSLFKSHVSDVHNRILQTPGDYAYTDKRTWDYTETFLDGMAGAFTMYSHLFGDLLKFKGPILNLDPDSLTTAFPKSAAHHWIFPPKNSGTEEN